MKLTLFSLFLLTTTTFGANKHVPLTERGTYRNAWHCEASRGEKDEKISLEVFVPSGEIPSMVSASTMDEFKKGKVTPVTGLFNMHYLEQGNYQKLNNADLEFKVESLGHELKNSDGKTYGRTIEYSVKGVFYFDYYYFNKKGLLKKALYGDLNLAFHPATKSDPYEMQGELTTYLMNPEDKFKNVEDRFTLLCEKKKVW